MSQPTSTARPRRVDAQRNYDRLLAVTRTAVAERGDDIALEDVAREAGVGIGTLYRHFPTRQALFEAAFVDEARELQDRAVTLADTPDAFAALAIWLRLQLDFGSHGHAMGAAVMNAKHVPGSEMQLTCASMRSAGAVLLRRAQDAGEARTGIEMGDVLRLIHGIVLANQHAPEPGRAERMFEVVIAGLRA